MRSPVRVRVRVLRSTSVTHDSLDPAVRSIVSTRRRSQPHPGFDREKLTHTQPRSSGVSHLADDITTRVRRTRSKLARCQMQP